MNLGLSRSDPWMTMHGIGPGHGFEVSQSARLVFGTPPPDSLPSPNSNEGVAD